MKPHFPPGSPGRAFYSDTNYQLLGAIIEAVTGDTYGAALEAGICAPLGSRSDVPVLPGRLTSTTRSAPC